MKIPVVGPAYAHPSIDVNNQRCVNLFIMKSGPNGKDPGALVPTSGLNLALDLGGVELRALNNINGSVYAVVDDSVYLLTVNETTEVVTGALLGTMDSSTGIVHDAGNPTQVMWVDGSTKGYIYTPSTATFEEITATDADFTGGGQVKFIDGYFVVNDPDTGKLYSSALNDGLSWDAADVVTAESSTDNIVGLAVVKGDLWVFGSKTVEIFYDAGNAVGSPFSARDGIEIQIGCGAANSIVEIDDLAVWLDDRGFIVQSNVSPFIRDNNSGYIVSPISTEALTAEILSYSRRDDAIAMTYNDRGHLMYQITFPTVKKTWVYDYTTKSWHERAYYNSYTEGYEHHLAQFATTYKNLQLMAGTRDGKIYLSKPTYYTDNDVPIHRIRTTPPQYDTTLNRRIEASKIELRMDTGQATQSGDGSDPQVTLRYSTDGGHTWSYHLARSFGKVGEYGKKVEWKRLGTANEWVFEFTIVEPISFSIIEAFAWAGSVEE